MSTVMSRRTLLATTGVAAAGAALAGAPGLAGPARAATRVTRSAATAAPMAGTARVGATVSPDPYQGGTSWDQAMADFNKDVGRPFKVAKRYWTGDVSTWPTVQDLGVKIQSLIDEHCRGLLCFQPATDGSDRDALVDSLNVIKAAGLTDVKVTLYQEQGLDLTPPLNAAQFTQVYDKYSEAVSNIFPLFVDFSGSHPETWACYRPAGVQGIAVDFYAETWAKLTAAGKPDPLGQLAQWADEAGQELGIWEIGNTASPDMPTKAQVQGYFGYLTSLQSSRLAAGHLIGDMAWYNGNGSNTISGTTPNPLYQTDRELLDGLFDTFNGVA
jgi:hypothetical protein